MKSNAPQTVKRVDRFKYDLILEGILVGALTGAIVSLFRSVLSGLEPIRSRVIDFAESGTGPLFLSLLLLFLLYLGTVLCLKFAPLISGSGIPQVKGEIIGRISHDWLRTLIGKLLGGVLAIGAGLSLGREGPSVQIGAMVGKGLSRAAKRLNAEEKILMSSGAGAGLAAAFSAPLAGVVFTLEELQKNFSTNLLLATMAASVTSDFVAVNIFGLKPVFDLSVRHAFPVRMYWLLIILGVLLGLLGVFYNRFTAFMQDLYDNAGPAPVKMIFPFLLVIVFAHNYRYVLGSGNFLVGDIASGKFMLNALVLLLLMKFIFSVLSFGSGAPGGIFLPLLVLGAICGGIFSEFACAKAGLDPELYLPNFVVLGMCGLFTSIVRSPITGVILITEMTGNFENFLSLSIVSLCAYVTADLLAAKPIYDQLLDRMLNKRSFYYVSRQTRRSKMVIGTTVYPGSRMDGEPIRMLDLPDDCLVVSVQRGETEMIPNGNTELRAGDQMSVLLRQEDMLEVDHLLERMCRTVRVKRK
ncbi:MAG: chloride channel protein [Anaerovoracaceae bacterium]|jgi:H+/Cl- antiporter ClcA